MPAPLRIRWWEPIRQSRLHMLSDLRPLGLTRPGLWIRLVVITAVIECLILAMTVWTQPGIVLPWAKLAILPFVGPAMVAPIIGLLFLVPRHVESRPAWIQITHAQHAIRIPREHIDGVALDHSDPPRLAIAYRSSRGAPRTADVAIAPTADLAAVRAWIATSNFDHFRQSDPP